MAAVTFPPNMVKDVAYDIARELFDEWLDANLPALRGKYDNRRNQLRTMREIGAGYLLAKLAQDEATAYTELHDFLTGHGRPPRRLLPLQRLATGTLPRPHDPA